MAYPVSVMIGIRTGGVFSAPKDVEDIKARIKKLVETGEKEEDTDLAYSIPSCRVPEAAVSQELSGSKGSYVVFAGVFNYWGFERSSGFAKILSEEFGTEVMIMSWDESTEAVDCQAYRRGQPLKESDEDIISGIMRRVCE